MIRNPFCTDIENIIKNNVKLISRYVSSENTIIESIYNVICTEYFENDKNALYSFIDTYLNNDGYEKYSYNNKMIEIVKFIITYSVFDELFDDKILSKLNISDINNCYDFKLLYKSDYYENENPYIYSVINRSDIISILNKYIDNKYKLSDNGNIVNTNNENVIKNNIISGNSFNDIDELTEYINIMTVSVTKLINIINNNINKIIKR